MIAEKLPVALKVYGHNTMFGLRAAGGFLCFEFWAMPDTISVVLFTEPKLAKAWLTKANRAGWQIEGIPQPLSVHPASMKPTINPSDDPAGITIIMKKSFYQNW